MTAPNERRIRRLTALVVLIVHVAGLIALARVGVSAISKPERALQISFITRPSPKPPLAVSIPSTPAKTQEPSHPQPTSSALMAVTVDAPEKATAPLKLSLTPAPDEWAAPAPVQSDNALTRPAYVDRLPSSAEPIVEGVQLGIEITPQLVVDTVGAFLFGARKINFCEDAKTHLANRRSARNRLSIEDDLRLIERDCRP